MSVKFFVCPEDHTIVEVYTEATAKLDCNGHPMKELKGNTTEAALEKHIPVVEVEGSKVTVKVGSVLHPMVPEHYIEWIYLETQRGGQRVNLQPGQDPIAQFALAEGETVVSCYAYCNLHSLWKAEL